MNCNVYFVLFAGTHGEIFWSDNFTCFVDCMLQTTALMYNVKGAAFVPTSIHKLVVDPRKHFSILKEMKSERKGLKIISYHLPQ